MFDQRNLDYGTISSQLKAREAEYEQLRQARRKQNFESVSSASSFAGIKHFVIIVLAIIGLGSY